MAEIAEWIAEFRVLHEKARKDELTGEIRAHYMSAREQFARALISAQGLVTPPGQTARQTFRVSQAFQIELRLGDDTTRSITLDVSRGGFSTLLAQPLELNEVVTFSMRLPGGDPISGRVRMVSSKKQTGNFRVSFAFERITDPELDRLEFVLFDCVLARMPK